MGWDDHKIRHKKKMAPPKSQMLENKKMALFRKNHMGLCENRAFFESYLETLSFYFLPYRFTLVQHPLHQTLSFSVLARLMVELSWPVCLGWF